MATGSAATKSNPAKESLRQEQRAQKEAARKKGRDDLDEALKDTFPASDPVAAQTATKPGAKRG
jgi:hypothetical protein